MPRIASVRSSGVTNRSLRTPASASNDVRANPFARRRREAITSALAVLDIFDPPYDPMIHTKAKN